MTVAIPPAPACRSVPPAPPAGRSASSGDLLAILRERFGFQSFLANQQEVCQAVVAGDDALLVMPTGSGKSLCYQLPGIALGGTTLVISPLIALMEDQTAKLREKGLRAEQIHSGRPREHARGACRAYLDGSLDFLTIAPERLSVPGFAEMLARRKPVLVAVDEAHCISHWGHDFRPDYRLLGARLPLLRPSPVLALTATATVRVQDDILAQLCMAKARRFIHGFRRENLAIEVAECPRSERVDLAVATLEPKDRRPALVYVPSRKMAEQAADILAKVHLRAASYHAGLDAQIRGQTQEAFQRGEIDVVVATIAFGMGIDKADIRTVIHLALPGTVEGYYQEIGRAGRDGRPARALLLYSWSDRKIHESFLERDYPGTAVLEGLLEKVPRGGIERSALFSFSDLGVDVAEPALGKLWIHGGVTVDADDVVRPGKPDWQPSYEAIRAHRMAQLDAVVDFAQSSSCRMVRLVRHFGETRDTRACGLCDACWPHGCIGRQLRDASVAELSVAQRIVDALGQRDGLAVGTLMREVVPADGMERRDFDRVLGALERAGALSLRQDEFEKDGKIIRFRRADLLAGARAALEGGRLLVEGVSASDGARRGRHAAKGPRPAKDAMSGTGPKRATGSTRATGSKRRSTTAGTQVGQRQPAASTPSDPVVEQRLRHWRQGLAKARGIPAFVILTDRTLQAIAGTKPTTLAELFHVKGMGPKLVQKYGGAILQVVRG